MSITLPPSLFTRSRYPADGQQSVNQSANRAADDDAAVSKSSDDATSGIVRLGSRQSAEDTAAAILGHVRNGLSELRSQGASDERLQQRLDAAREGIERGYKEATAMLKDMGMLDDELQTNIDNSRSMVDQGLSDMESNLASLDGGIMSSRTFISAGNAMSLQVMTRDGDRVTVNFAQSSALSAAQGDGYAAMRSSSRQGWQMQVSGTLSAEEKQALENLFNDVQALSEQFFAGDIGAALEDAMNLGMDGSQLAAMSLSLTQKSVSSVTTGYAKPTVELPTPELEALKAPLAYYAERYIKALDDASALQQPKDVFRDMVHQLLPEEPRLKAWDFFHEGLNKLVS
ncbi:DUF5610 domain-containing protein [Thalassolituus marinus]|uniref:DUF5610 domain-containing protein n=1 Tax=Thalassolituus marinus TaxID=671053 RepID=A0ABS7ZWW2_9GAMM|nr:DUF5610 domain-containing protein [Thalassolituus marinus]MCA6064891.1 DUF5610 domain-containing protein [Thalassolituus marinus]